MKNAERFRENLEILRLKAQTQGGEISVQDVAAVFALDELFDDEIRLIYRSLSEEGIRLKEYVPHDTASMSLSEMVERSFGEPEPLSEEEASLLDMYEDDLAAIPPLSSAEEERLTRDLLAGGQRRQTAVNRLTEGNLRWVLSLAKAHAGQGVPLGDLIQEGSMAVLTALAEYTEGLEMMDFLEERITSAMEEAIREQSGLDRRAVRLAADANRILDFVREREAETMEALTAEEIAQGLHMSVERVKLVMEESARAMKNVEKG